MEADNPPLARSGTQDAALLGAHERPCRLFRQAEPLLARAGRAADKALDVPAAERAQRRLLAQLAQAQRAIDAQPVAASAHRNVQRLVQADTCTVQTRSKGSGTRDSPDASPDAQRLVQANTCAVKISEEEAGLHQKADGPCRRAQVPTRSGACNKGRLQLAQGMTPRAPAHCMETHLQA